MIKFKHTQRLQNHILIYLFFHGLFQILVGPIQIFGPDEQGYLNTFNRLYEKRLEFPQAAGGWITTPLISLRVLYFVPKLLSLIGFDELLALRLWSILLSMLGLAMLQKFYKKYNQTYSVVISLVFFIPSIFIWFSLALREVYIFLFMVLTIIGFNGIYEDKRRNQFFFIMLIGLIGLISTKNYLWVVIVIALFITVSLLTLIERRNLKSTIMVLLAMLLSFLFYLSTASNYQINFFLNANAFEVGERSGESISRIEYKSDDGKSQVIEINGDTTLIMLQKSLSENPNLVFNKVIKFIGFDSKINQMYSERVKKSFKGKYHQIQNELDIEVKPGKLNDPKGLFLSIRNFLFYPAPWQQNLSFTARILSLESLLWSALYLLMLYKIFQIRICIFKKENLPLKPVMILSCTILFGLILLSAITEVNLGTAFRHRSILITPLIMIYSVSSYFSKKNSTLT